MRRWERWTRRLRCKYREIAQTPAGATSDAKSTVFPPESCAPLALTCAATGERKRGGVMSDERYTTTQFDYQTEQGETCCISDWDNEACTSGGTSRCRRL